MLTLLLLLQLKHLVIDWILQPPYMWQNKGTYGHPGGLIHAGLNAAGTAACFLVLSLSMWQLLIVVCVDFILHYHIDFAKMNINKINKWACNTHPQFWWLTGLDQFLHQVTYLLLIYITI